MLASKPRVASRVTSAIQSDACTLDTGAPVAASTGLPLGASALPSWQMRVTESETSCCASLSSRCVGGGSEKCSRLASGAASSSSGVAARGAAISSSPTSTLSGSTGPASAGASDALRSCA